MLTHKGTVTLRTARLTLRRFILDDAQAVHDSYTSDEHVAKYHDMDAHMSVEDTSEMLIESIADYDNLQNYYWAVEYDGIIVGEINFFDIDNEQGKCEVGYTVGSKWWNHGIATEALAEVIRFAFAEVNLNKVFARTDPVNISSCKVMQKNNMKQEGLFREDKVRKDGTRRDTVFYAALKREWMKDWTMMSQ